jgi:hypothetical protein
MMIRRSLLAAPALLAALAINSGCAKPSIVGKWSGDVTGPQGVKLPVQVEYRADGTETATFNGTSVEATWSMQGETLTYTITGTSHEGKKSPYPEQTYVAKVNLQGDNLTLSPTTGGQGYSLTRDK